VGQLLLRKEKGKMGGPSMDVGLNMKMNRKIVFEFWQLKWVNSNGNLNFE
jgi:hypothetical protein